MQLIVKFVRRALGRIGRELSPYVSGRWEYRIQSWISVGCTKGGDVYLHPTVQMLGAANITIGSSTCVSEQTWLNVNHRKVGEIAISIGDNCFIGRRNFFSSGKKIEIGHYVLTTADCKFVCSSHITDDPLVPYVVSGITSDGVICIGANCFFGVNSMVLGNVTIGHGSVIGANSFVTRDVPPFSMVVGNPAKILRRYSFSKKVWIANESVTNEDISENPNEALYLEMLRLSWPKISMPIIAAGSDLGNL